MKGLSAMDCGFGRTEADLRNPKRCEPPAASDCYIPDGFVSKYPNLQAIILGTIAGAFREWPMVRRELQSLDADINSALMESAAFYSLLTDICNEFMDVGADGKFFGSELAERANKLLGI